jgi:hypothetical protein
MGNRIPMRSRLSGGWLPTGWPVGGWTRSWRPARGAAISPLPVPEPGFIVPELGVLAYRKLPGVPLLDLARRGWSVHTRRMSVRRRWR